MDHLPYPQAPAVPIVRVPYVCSVSYDQEDFHTYPVRKDWQLVLDCLGRLAPGSCRHDNCRRQFPGLEDFAQTWLFFGLLHAILGKQYRENDFIRSDGSGKTLDTTLLTSMLMEKLNGQHSLDSIHSQMQCLRTTLRTVQKVFIVSRLLPTEKENWSGGKFSYNRLSRSPIWLSILCLGETLTWFFRSLSGADTGMESAWRSTYTSLQYPQDSAHTFDWVEEAMIRNGWCQSRAHRVSGQFFLFASLHFLSGLKAPGLAGQHEHCTLEVCRRSQISLSNYEPIEAPGCHCDLVGHSDEGIAIAAALRNDTYPLLRIKGHSVSDVALEVEFASEGKPYVALSHVWADGLGNPDACALHGCQLLRLKSLISRLEGVEVWEEGPILAQGLLLWCDTVCVPPHDPSKDHFYQVVRDSAMGRMRQVYENATYVLILDPSLEQYALEEVGAVEAAFRLLMSPWMERLWTLQEVLLAKKPLIQFKDGAVDLRILWKTVKETCRGSPLLQPLDIDIDPHVRRLRALVSAYEFTTTQRLIYIYAALSHRRVTVPSDENVCLCTLLNLDVSALLKVPADKRTEMFWTLLGATEHAIPSYLLMLNVPRLKTRRYRWAPVSLLNAITPTRIATNAGYLMLQSESSWGGQLHDKGLAVQLAGFCLEYSEPSPALTAQDQMLCDRFLADIWSNTLHVRDEAGHWYRFVPERDVDPGNVQSLFSGDKGSLVILYHSQEGYSARLTARCAHVVEKAGQAMVVNPSALVMLNKEDESEQQIWNAAYARAQSHRQAGTAPKYLSMVRENRRHDEEDRDILTLKSTGNPESSSIAQLIRQLRVDAGSKHDTTAQSSIIEQVKSLHPIDYDEDLIQSAHVVHKFGQTPIPKYDFATRVLTLLYGRYFTVTQTFDGQTTWYVQ